MIIRSMRNRAAVLVLTAFFSSGQLAAQVFLADDATYETCSGTFHDSGGPSGNYGNNETFVTTLCPIGGAGAGPLTSVTFTAWSVAPGPGDQLFVFDGATDSGTPLAIGSSSNSLNGQSFTATAPDGCLTFRWESDGSGTAAGWTAQITTGPNAGEDASITVCTSEAPFSMRLRLGGTPETGGTWTGPLGNTLPSSLFDPATGAAGIYTYTVTGAAPCPSATATLTIAKVQARDPGSSSNLSLCGTDGPVDLFLQLGPSAEPGGTWTGPGGPHSGTFDPATDPPGPYVYALSGTAPCPDTSATVTVTVNVQPFPGTDGTVEVCSNDPSFSLFNALGGSPDGGGAWTGPDLAPVASTYVPGTSAPGIYTYTVIGQPPCPTLSATVTVVQTEAPNAGISRSITVCSDEDPFDMRLRLNGSPQEGGTWTGPDGPHGDAFDPANDTPGAYVYLVPGTPPCADATATLTITVRTAPNAGISSTLAVCSSDGNQSLLAALDGSPAGNGTWTNPDGQPHSGTFIPGTSTEGVYTYTVVGQSPCDPAVSTVTVSVTPAPNAGSNASISVCSSDDPFDLVDELGGTPDGGGVWTGPLGAHGAVFTPGSDEPGTYTYTVSGTSPCANATALLSITVVNAPDAGISADTTVCGTGSPFSLFELLGGTPAVTGTWTRPDGGPSNGIFSPASSQAGTYTYTVQGQSPCSNVQSTVEVTVVTPPNAGTSASLTICSSDAPVDLFSLLGGDPETGGSWTRPNGTPHPGGGIYNPATEPGGNYVYTVMGMAPCANATATVVVQRVIAPNAGTDGSVALCSTSSSLNLINVLGGNPAGNGFWLDPDLQPHPEIFDPGSSVAGVYAYVVEGTAPCANDTAWASVVVNEPPDAGANASITVCSNDDPLELIDQLLGDPDDNGTWTGPDGLPFNGLFVPGTSDQGVHTYTVPGLSPCLAASAVVTVSVSQQPDPGEDATFETCSTDDPVDLFTILGGSPAAGGSWLGPDGPGSGIFIPGTSTAGDYVYSIAGPAPCLAATATVTAVVNPAPNAGVGDTLTVCTDSPVVNLFDQLTGNPDQGGTWTELNSTGQLAGSFINPAFFSLGSYGFQYTVEGIGICEADEAIVVVTIVEGLDAGTSGSLTACSSNTQVNLFNGLGGAPQQGGVWVDVGNTGALNGQFFNAAQTGPGSYLFTYELEGTSVCASASANVTVNVTQAPNAGVSASTTVCSNAGLVPLFPLLGATAQTGGIWRIGSINGPTFGGNYDPDILSSGVYYYVVEGAPPCTNAFATVTVTEVQAPNPGIGSTIQVCSTDPQFNMTALLGGNPQPGSWSFNNQSHSPNFVPGLDAQGVYVYTVQGNPPCSPASAFLIVNVEQAPFAGPNASTTVCSDGADISLFSLLGPAATAGGTWTDPNDETFGGTYSPSTSEPGVYTYVVGGTSVCPSDTALVTVFENPAANAGQSSSVNLCSNGPIVNLLDLLGGTPDANGTWVGPAPLNPPFSGIFQPGVSEAGMYTYTVPGIAPCTNKVATLNVGVSEPANAGTSNSITVCSSTSAFDMLPFLTNATGGGVWSGPLPSTTPVSGVFTPGTTTPGTYRYTLNGNGGCPPSTATLTIAVSQSANAGGNANLSVCSTDGSVQLFPLLGPNAQPGGVWIRQSDGAPVSGTILPSVDQSDTYVYTVTPQAPCQPVSALVAVEVVQAPNAGFGGVVTVCDTDLAFALADLLNGGPDPMGTWSGPEPGWNNGLYFPATMPGGVYTYTVGTAGGACPIASASITVIRNEQPNAGSDGAVEVCSNQGNVDLFQQLGGSPDPDGSWTGPGDVASTGTYVPGTSTPGLYRYVLVGDAPCVSDTSFVNVIQYQAPNAGISTVATICSADPVVPLVDLLGGTPNTIGTWTYNGDPHGPDLDPATAGSGTYAYTVIGQPPCTNATAQVQLIVVSAPNPGTSGNLARCVDDPAIVLFPGLGGNPQTGGTWTNLSGEGVLVGGTWDATGVAPGNFAFTYTVTGSSPCSNASSTVTVSVASGLDAGNDTTVTICANQTVDLFANLAGTPQSGGFWVDLDGSNALLVGNIFNASLVSSGTTWRFDHVLPGSNQCPADTARLTINVQLSPFAGCDGVSTQCSNAFPVNLATAQSCGPNGPGQWFGPGGEAHSGTYLPATDPPGIYTFVVAGVGDCPSDSAFVTVNLVPAPNAGGNASVSICSTDPPQNLFPALGPNAQPGGSWTCLSCPGVPSFSGVYNPATDAPGNYQYSVAGTSPCASATAVVTVLEPQAPFAGTSANASYCSTGGPANMLTALGNPDPNGTWMGPNAVHDGIFFDPATDDPGLYTYTVIGVSPCANASATLNISVTPQNNAGSNATVTACIGQGQFDLLPLLGANVTTGGTWSGSGVAPNGFFDPSLTGVGTFICTYGFPANGPCPAVSSTVTVSVITGLSAGEDSSVEVCGANEAFDLFGALGGNPQPGGTWADPFGIGGLNGDSLDATQITPDLTGQFTYTVTDPQCGPVTAVLTVTVRPFPNPGVGGALVLCNTDDPIDLFQQLQGTPMASGTWTAPSGSAHGNTFDPATHDAGDYVYTVEGNLACPDSSATVQITVNVPPDAGSNGQIMVCDTLPALDLFAVLQGNPQPGGTWTDLDGSGALTGGSLNTTLLDAGDLRFRYTLDVPACGSASAEVLVQVNSSLEISVPVLVCNTVDRTYTVSFTIAGGDEASYVVDGLQGSLEHTALVLFTSSPIPTSDPFVAWISDQYACNVVRVEGVSPCDFSEDVFIPQAFSPNNDGINDSFVIPGIEGFPNNKIVIFNRWGGKMYEGVGYNNRTVVWDGTSPDGLYGGMAPSGTYFYILELGNEREPLTGYIYLNR
jgi:gliding motility-associated-like protein